MRGGEHTGRGGIVAVDMEKNATRPVLLHSTDEPFLKGIGIFKHRSRQGVLS